MGTYLEGAFWEIAWSWLRYFSVETLSDGVTVPFFLALAGLGLMDLAYLLGLLHLVRYRRALKHGKPGRGQRGTGWLTAAGTLVLLPVLINTIQLYAGLDYSPYDLEGSGFVTLTEIEGEDISISRRQLYNMDYISHGGTLLDPESWYFQQYAAFGDNQSPDDIPRLEVTAVRYPLELLAQLRAEERTRIYTNGSSDFQDLGAVEGVDQIFYAPREEWTHTNELTGQTRVFLPGGELVLRKGSTVLYADYYGYQDLTDHLPAFVRTLNSL